MNGASVQVDREWLDAQHDSRAMAWRAANYASRAREAAESEVGRVRHVLPTSAEYAALRAVWVASVGGKPATAAQLHAAGDWLTRAYLEHYVRQPSVEG